MRITRETAIPTEEIGTFYKLYMESFAELARRSALRQWMTADEFRAEMTDPAVVKIVGWDDDGLPAAILCDTNEVRCVPWLNPEFYEELYPEEFARKALWWVGTILVHPDRRGGHFVGELIKENVRLLLESDGVCLFDCCHHNLVDVHLPEIVHHFASEVVPVVYEEIDTQHFYAMRRQRSDIEAPPL